MSSAGYSSTPLSKKLGYMPGMRVHWINAPEHYAELLGDSTSEVTLLKAMPKHADLIHLFTTKRSLLERRIKKIGEAIHPDGMLWVSWPKKAAAKKHGIVTDMTEDVVREIVLPPGLVDVKVCAVDEIWSGLKIMWRKELR